MTARLKSLFLVLLLAALLAAGAVLPLPDGLSAAVDWIDGRGALAWAVYVLAYIVATVLLVPGSVLTLAAGFLFGLPLGVALVSAGSVLGAASAFLVGRFFARDWVAERTRPKPSFRALDKAIAGAGFTVVLLARLSPLFPFNLLNYGLGLSAVRFRDYVLASWIGMLPATVVYVYIGTLAKDLAQLSIGQFDAGWASRGLLIAGFVATVVLVVLIARKASQALARHLQRGIAEEQ